MLGLEVPSKVSFEYGLVPAGLEPPAGTRNGKKTVTMRGRFKVKSTRGINLQNDS